MSRPELFLSYHTADAESVQAVRRAVEARGVTTFLDRRDLPPGLPWPAQLERALGEVAAVAVFLGPHGLGRWQRRELWLALDRQATSGETPFPVIPVLLPGARKMAAGFLSLNTWIDLRRGLEDDTPLDALARAVRGEGATWSQATAAAEPAAAPLCPYRSLRYFREEDAAFFFGRERESEKLLEAVDRRSLVAVVGPSGSGKSSVVRAGLLPRLRRQRPPRPGWEVALATPGERPFHRLAAALVPLLEPDAGEVDRLAESEKLGRKLAAGEIRLGPVVERLLAKSGGSDRLLLVVDQLEELFTQAPEGERRPFAELLLQARDAPMTLLVTLRGDFYGRAIALHPGLSEGLEEGTVNVGPMGRTGLERAVVEPARRVGLELEPGLTERILDDVGDEPGRLPLLEFALARLWEKREGRSLTHKGYAAVGEVSGAIAQQADELYQSMDRGEQQALRKAFTRLVRLARPEEGSEDTRRRVPLADLEEAAHPLVRRLADERLLVTGRDPATGAETVEVAHEALIREWETLQRWLAEDRAFLLWRQGLAPAVAGWQAHSGDPSYLLTGSRLVHAREWAAARGEELSPAERQLVAASVGRRRRSAGLRALQAVLAIGLLAGVVYLGMEIFQRQRVDTARLLAQRSEEARDRFPQRAVLLAAEAIQATRRADLPHQAAAESALRKALAQCGGIPLEHPDPRVLGAVLGEKGRWLVTETAEGLMRLTPLTPEAEIADEIGGLPEPFDPGGRLDVEFSPDGTWLATAGDDHPTALWRLDDGGAEPAFETLSNRPELAWSPDGSLLATGAKDGTVRLWDLAARPPWEPQGLQEDRGGSLVKRLVFSRDRRWLAVLQARNEVTLWDLQEGGRKEAPLSRARHDLSFSPDSSTLAIGGVNGVEVMALSTGAGVSLDIPQEPIRQVDFSPGGMLLASTGETLYFWPPGNPRSARPQSQHLSGRPVISRRGGWLAAIAENRLTAGRLDPRPLSDGFSVLPAAELKGHDAAVRGLAFTPGERSLLSWDAAGLARRWELVPGPLGAGLEPRRLGRGGINFLPSQLHPWGLAFTGGGAGLVAVVQPTSFEPQPLAAAFDLHPGAGATSRPLKCSLGAAMTALAPGGDWAAAVTDAGQVCRWRLNGSGQELASSVHPLGEAPVFLQPGGQDFAAVLLALSGDGDWMATRKKGRPGAWAGRIGGGLAPLPTSGHTRAWMETLAFDGEGRWLAGARGDGAVFLWPFPPDAGSPSLLLPGHDGRPRALSFSPDDRWLFSGADGDGGRLWDLAAIDAAGAVKVSRAKGVASAGFDPGGRWLAVGSTAGLVDLLDLSHQPPEDLEPPLPLAGQPVRLVAFDGGGERLFAVAEDSTARLWDLSSEDPEVTAVDFPEMAGTSAAAFSPDGRSLATAGDDGVLLWDLDLGSLLDKACRAAGRNLTCDEWRQALADEPYRKVCPDLPGPADASRPGAADPCR